MWICPECSRTFKNKNQWHSCVNTSVDTFLHGKPEPLISLYHLLINSVKKFGPLQIQTVQSAILVKTGSTFLEIKFAKDHLRIAFYLDHETKEFPVVKSLRVSKNRVAHVVCLGKKEDLDSQMINWLKHSYLLVKK